LIHPYHKEERIMAGTTTQHILAKYRKIIFAVILFMVADSLVIGINFYSTYKANESAVSINLSGRQRMLSQRMTKALLLLQRSQEAGDEAGIERNLKELNLAVNLFDSTLKGFRDGDIVTGGDGNKTSLAQVNTGISRKIVADAYLIWDPYLEKLQPLLGNNPRLDKIEPAVTYAQANNLEMLRLMNDLTSDLELVANSRAETLRIVLIVGIFVALINFGYTVIISIRDLMAGDAEISRAREETSEILSTVQEGLFLLDKDRKLGSQFSASLPQILHREIHQGMNFMTVLSEMVTNSIFHSAEDYIDLLLGDRVKEALVASLNPLTNVPITVKSVVTNENQKRYLSFFFNRVMVGNTISHLLVTVQDVTDRVLLTQQVEQARNQSKIEVEALLRLLSSDYGSLQQFIDNTSNALAQINSELSQTQDSGRDRLHAVNSILRLVHGIKGEAATLGIDMLETYAHESEKEIVEMREGGDSVTGDHMVRITVLLEGFYERFSSLAEIITRFGEAMSGRLTAPVAPDADAAAPAAHPKDESAEITGRINALAQRIAKDQDKQVEVSCYLEEFQELPRRVVHELSEISIQLVRNAMAHGIETPSERTRKNKSPTGEIRITCDRLENGRYDFIVRDDGRGIVVDRLREHLIRNGYLNKTEAANLNDADVARQIFQPGVSTADKVSRDAGHGIGLDVVHEKVQDIDGHLLVRSRADRFTEFRIQFGI
jgi:HPt (histidine-containing phosphotransfer) domain-containing protein/two-component sensor histidine kinase